ncbi:MAG: LytTR family transcriptional regulator [Herbinix sp.]|jgi:DNA-binding LytR/AlgR family response regulator|nr:LytTR family transcriptional regulator [Herbinix sp.]
MKINQYKDKKLIENYIDIHYKEMNAEIQGILEYCETMQTIIGKRDNEQKKILPSEIYYCEIVDRKCYAYLDKEVYQIDFTIQKLLDLCLNKGFVRISKAMVVNVFKIDHLKTDLNMRVHIYMENGEKVILNRTYKKEFFDYLNQKGSGYETN